MTIALSSRPLHFLKRSGISPLRLFTRAMSQTQRPPKRFAPLDPQKDNVSRAPPLKGIVFDVDGTLWYVCLIDCDDTLALKSDGCEGASIRVSGSSLLLPSYLSSLR